MKNVKNEIEIIRESGFFDPKWYLSEYSDVVALKQDPIEHYLRIGAHLLRNPSTKFDTAHYLRSNLDVAASKANPLVHFIMHGLKEGRSPLPSQADAGQYVESIDIVVPVYNALEDVKLCLKAISERHDGFPVRAVVVNDGSNEETSSWLREYCSRHEEFHLIEHEKNSGYTKAVNTGLRATMAPYVITLNSDTIVTRGWLKGLVRCINSDSRIGIAGPLSNAASWQNVPALYDENGAFAVNELPQGMSPDEMAVVVASVSKRVYPRSPFVNGFCFMIKRKVIQAVGFMDDENFPVGYGEENDFCIRAADAGFTLAIADDTYVFHAKSKSFGHEKRKELSRQGSETLKRKHTAKKFDALVQKVKITTELDKVRKAVTAALCNRRIYSEEPWDIMAMRVLFLLPVRGGGGGAHSVVQEVSEMRRLGVQANIAVKAQDVENFLELYGDIPNASEVFIGFDIGTVLSLAEEYDVVVATVFTSVEIVHRISRANPSILPAYYVQDYEPLFFQKDSKQWRVAFDSYTLVPNLVLFAKTQWIADRVYAEHAVHVHKVEPSIDHGVYKPALRNNPGRIHIAAMIRPQTPRRGADRTMRVLSRLAKRHPDRISFYLFGCEEQSEEFQSLLRNFEYVNLGVLKRTGVTNLLAQSDIFVDLSDYQAFGRTALEAMACGCTAMVPMHGGTDEYAIDDVNAMVVDSFDEQECLRRLDEIITTPGKLKRMQQAGLLTAANYSIHSAAISELTMLAKEVARHRSLFPAPIKEKLSVVPALTQPKGGGAQHPTGSAYVRLITPYIGTPVARQEWRIEIAEPNMLPKPGSSKVAVLQRDVNRASLPQLKEWLNGWRAAGGRFIWEIDDDLFDVDTLATRKITTDPVRMVEKVNWLAQNADVVTVSTSTLAMKVRKFNANVHVVPNYLATDLWRLEGDRDHKTTIHGRKEHGAVKIGYIGTPSHVQDAGIVAQAMQRIAQEYGDCVEIEVIGVFQNTPPTFGQRIGLPKKSDYPNFVNWLQERVHWDIGIIPLVDESFNKSKSNLKFLEYAALDMAIVVSDVDTYRDVASSGHNSLVVENSMEAWYSAVKSLIEDPDKRKRLAKQARNEVIERYTIEGNPEVYLSVLSAAMSAR